MTMTRSLVYIIPAIVTAVVVSGPRFLEVETADICLDLRDCDGDCDYYQEWVGTPVTSLVTSVNCSHTLTLYKSRNRDALEITLIQFESYSIGNFLSSSLECLSQYLINKWPSYKQRNIRGIIFEGTFYPSSVMAILTCWLVIGRWIKDYIKIQQLISRTNFSLESCLIETYSLKYQLSYVGDFQTCGHF